MSSGACVVDASVDTGSVDLGPVVTASVVTKPEPTPVVLAGLLPSLPPHAATTSAMASTADAVRARCDAVMLKSPSG